MLAPVVIKKVWKRNIWLEFKVEGCNPVLKSYCLAHNHDTFSLAYKRLISFLLEGKASHLRQSSAAM